MDNAKVVTHITMLIICVTKTTEKIQNWIGQRNMPFNKGVSVMSEVPSRAAQKSYNLH